MAGRKSLKEEIKIIERLTALSAPTFDYINGLYLAGDKEDKKWAVEQMMKLYSKCIPTELTTDPENPFVVMAINYITPKENAEPSDNTQTDLETTLSQPSVEQSAS